MKRTVITKNSYATDGLCHNANVGTFGHECGKPAMWLGAKDSGFKSGYCDHCKQHGDEARAVTQWTRVRFLPQEAWQCDEVSHG